MSSRRVIRLVVPVLVGCGVLLGTLGFFSVQNARQHEAARSDAVRRAGDEAVALQRQLDRALNAPIALAAHVQLNDGRIDGFEEFTDQMRGLVPSITNLQLAPDGVVRHIHPLEGNEAAIGHELLVDRERTTEAFAAIEGRRLTLAGPFELVQGGVAMVGRQPVYVAGAAQIAGVDPDFWGFATVLIDLDDFFEASRIGELMGEGYVYELSSFDRDLEEFVPFRTSGTLRDPVQVEVSVANGTWQLALARPGGWGAERWSAGQVVLAAMAAIAAVLGVRRFQRRDARLSAAVEARTAELRTANLELSHARDAAEQANAAKTAFLANVSHELRTPMNAILGFAELIDPADLEQRDRASLDQIQRAGQHLLELINQVLDVTAIEAGHLDLDLVPVQTGDVVRRVCALLEPLAVEAGVSLECDASDATALANDSRLFQVVANLTTNAIRFTPEAGSVRVSTDSVGGWCHLTVADDGVGIPDDALDRIFEPFERGAAPATVTGTGIGLAIVDRLVTAMNGTITVESAVGIGSTFRISIPSADPAMVGGRTDEDGFTPGR